MNKTCKYCKSQVSENFYFCPNCGKKIKELPFKFSFSKSVGILVFSILFPPFGIIPGLRYLFKNDVKAQAVGLFAVALTIISTVVLVIFTRNFINRTLNSYNQILELQSISE